MKIDQLSKKGAEQLLPLISDFFVATAAENPRLARQFHGAANGVRQMQAALAAGDPVLVASAASTITRHLHNAQSVDLETTNDRLYIAARIVNPARGGPTGGQF